jgi:hypothetical protein
MSQIRFTTDEDAAAERAREVLAARSPTDAFRAFLLAVREAAEDEARPGTSGVKRASVAFLDRLRAARQRIDAGR